MSRKVNKSLARRANSLGISLTQDGQIVRATWDGRELEDDDATEALRRMATIREEAIALEAEEPETDEAETDEAETEDEAPRSTRSVVAERYRAEYRARGNPDHCGDWLARELAELCTTASGFDMGFFRAIEEANGTTNKCKLEKPSDIGRYRMTGRNLLQKAVWTNKGLKMPEHFRGGEFLPAPGEWLEAKAPKKKVVA